MSANNHIIVAPGFPNGCYFSGLSEFQTPQWTFDIDEAKTFASMASCLAFISLYSLKKYGVDVWHFSAVEN